MTDSGDLDYLWNRVKDSSHSKHFQQIDVQDYWSAKTFLLLRTLSYSIYETVGSLSALGINQLVI